MQGQPRLDPSTWRPQTRLAANIASLRQLRAFNDTGGIAVNFDVMRAVAPDIALVGSQSETLSLWETRSASGFVTKPKFNADLVTIRFVTAGQITYRHRRGTYQGSPTHATLVGFDDLSEVQTSEAFSAVAGTIAVAVLEASQAALTGGEHRALPPLEPVAELATPGLMALFCTVRQVQRQIREAHPGSDFTFHLIQEILGYQLLSAWPKRTAPTLVAAPDIPPPQPARRARLHRGQPLGPADARRHRGRSRDQRARASGQVPPGARPDAGPVHHRRAPRTRASRPVVGPQRRPVGRRHRAALGLRAYERFRAALPARLWAGALGDAPRRPRA